MALIGHIHNSEAVNICCVSEATASNSQLRVLFTAVVGSLG